MLRGILELLNEDDNGFKGGVIACDLDGTLAEIVKGQYKSKVIGKPIPKMIDRVKSKLEAGKKVVIFTARASDPDEIKAIKAWCREHIGQVLPVTNIKKPEFIEFWDDRAVPIKRDTGENKEE